MIIIGSAMALTMAAYFAEPAEQARIAYNNCLVDITTEHLDRKDSKSAFEKASESACSDEMKAFRDIIVKEEKGYGSAQSEAEDYADEEVQGVIASYVEAYKGYASSNSRPTKE